MAIELGNQAPFVKYLIVLNTLWKLEVNNRKHYKAWMFSINFANFFFDHWPDGGQVLVLESVPVSAAMCMSKQK